MGIIAIALSGCSGLRALASDGEPSLEAVEPVATEVSVVVQLPTLTAIPSPTASLTPSPSPTATMTEVPTATPSSTPSPTLEPDAETWHEVQPGEQVDEIARRYGVPLEALMAYNGLDGAVTVLPGDSLRVPLGEASQAAMMVTATAVRHATSTAVTAALTPTAIPMRVTLPMLQDYQGLNNCAPATTSMILTSWGLNTTETSMVALQKPGPSDVNVTAEEVAASMKELGMGAFVGIGGDIATIERLLAAGFPVMTEEWMNYDGGVGHFRALRGFDREQEQIFYNDSYYGPDLWRSYATFLRDWKPYNNKFIVAYPREREQEVRRLVGEVMWNERSQYEQLREQMIALVEADPSDAYAWWGLGEAQLRLDQAPEAVQSFERALSLGTLPWRYLWYRYGYFEALNRVGRYEDLLAATAPTLAQMKRSEDLRYHRAIALQALGRIEEARTELRTAIQENPRFIPARVLLESLPPAS